MDIVCFVRFFEAAEVNLAKWKVCCHDNDDGVAVLNLEMMKNSLETQRHEYLNYKKL